MERNRQGFDLRYIAERRELKPPRDHCAVFAIYAPGQDVAQLTLQALNAMQNRGPESSGTVVSNGKHTKGSWGLGEVRQVFGTRTAWEGYDGEITAEYIDRDHLPRLPDAYLGVGHNRYGTMGSSTVANAGPFLVHSSNGQDLADNSKGPLGAGHNGNVTNSGELKEIILERGCHVKGSTDSEIVANLIASQPGDTWEEKMIAAMSMVHGSFSLAMIAGDKIYGIRDGNRPLCVGTIGDQGWVIASESHAIHAIGGQFLREVEPGEYISAGADGLKTFYKEKGRLPPCPLEPVYGENPDTIWERNQVAELRFRAGELLYKYYPVEGAQVVSGIPYSALYAAEGFSHASGIPFFEALFKSRWAGRIFMDPNQEKRIDKTERYALISSLIRRFGIKSMVLLEDSIVRGTTGGLLHKFKEDFPDLELHLRIVMWPVRHPCFFGFDFGTYEELLRTKYKETVEVAKRLGVASLEHLNVEQLAEALQVSPDAICQSCHTGDYYGELKERTNKFHLE